MFRQVAIRALQPVLRRAAAPVRGRVWCLLLLALGNRLRVCTRAGTPYQPLPCLFSPRCHCSSNALLWFVCADHSPGHAHCCCPCLRRCAHRRTPRPVHGCAHFCIRFVCAVPAGGLVTVVNVKCIAWAYPVAVLLFVALDQTRPSSSNCPTWVTPSQRALWLASRKVRTCAAPQAGVSRCCL